MADKSNNLYVNPKDKEVWQIAGILASIRSKSLSQLVSELLTEYVNAHEKEADAIRKLRDGMR